MAKAPAGDREHSKGEQQQYAPSWADRFTAWVDRLPGRNWSYYSGMGKRKDRWAQCLTGLMAG